MAYKGHSNLVRMTNDIKTRLSMPPGFIYVESLFVPYLESVIIRGSKSPVLLFLGLNPSTPVISFMAVHCILLFVDCLESQCHPTIELKLPIAMVTISVAKLATKRLAIAGKPVRAGAPTSNIMILLTSAN